MVNFLDTRLPDRFWSKVQPCPMSGCWIWTGAMHQHGYGQFGIRGKVLRAHRASYEFLVGAIPEDLEIDHRCFTKCCVNPLHLEAVTHQENTRRSALFRRLAFCKRGHSRADDNLNFGKRRNASPLRQCRTCHLERRRSIAQFGLSLAQVDAVNLLLRSA